MTHAATILKALKQIAAQEFAAANETQDMLLAMALDTLTAHELGCVCQAFLIQQLSEKNSTQVAMLKAQRAALRQQVRERGTTAQRGSLHQTRTRRTS